MERKLFNTTYSDEIPNLGTVVQEGTKSYLEITSREFPTEEGGRWGQIRRDLWIEEHGKDLDWRLMAIGTLGAMQYAIDHPERQVHLVKYWFKEWRDK